MRRCPVGVSSLGSGDEHDHDTGGMSAGEGASMHGVARYERVAGRRPGPQRFGSIGMRKAHALVILSPQQRVFHNRWGKLANTRP